MAWALNALGRKTQTRLFAASIMYRLYGIGVPTIGKLSALEILNSSFVLRVATSSSRRTLRNRKPSSIGLVYAKGRGVLSEV
jgi:hypothetical protein